MILSYKETIMMIIRRFSFTNKRKISHTKSKKVYWSDDVGSDPTKLSPLNKISQIFLMWVISFMSITR